VLHHFLTASDYKSSSTPYLKKLQDVVSSLPNFAYFTLDKDSPEAYMLLMSKRAKSVMNPDEE
jgi:hypothetical protein